MADQSRNRSWIYILAIIVIALVVVFFLWPSDVAEEADLAGEGVDLVVDPETTPELEAEGAADAEADITAVPVEDVDGDGDLEVGGLD
ncbi:MAG: hypothetical protein ACU0BF_11625 [Paracoccaceae bacterium]